MIELLIIAIYLGVNGFCAQICVGLARGSCTRKGGHDYMCDHGGWYFTALLGFFLPMIMVGMLVAKRSGLDLTEKERHQRELERAEHQTNLALEAAETAKAESKARIAEIEALNAQLALLNPGMRPLRAE